MTVRQWVKNERCPKKKFSEKLSVVVLDQGRIHCGRGKPYELNFPLKAKFKIAINITYRILSADG